MFLQKEISIANFGIRYLIITTQLYNVLYDTPTILQAFFNGIKSLILPPPHIYSIGIEKNYNFSVVLYNFVKCSLVII